GPAALFATSLSDSIDELILEKSIISYRSVVDADVHYQLERTVIPGILQSLDLPDVMQLLKQNLTLVSAARSNGTTMPDLEFQQYFTNEIPFIRLIRGEGWNLKSTIPDLFF